jgi:hypothetical protein
MSNGRVLLIVSAIIAAGVSVLLWQRIQDCFFTEGQSCPYRAGFKSGIIGPVKTN